MARPSQEFQSIRSEGGLLPYDLLRRVTDARSSLEGTRPEDYGLPVGERLNEAITQSWSRLQKYWAEFRAAAAGITNEAGTATALTNERWTLPLLKELQFGILPTTPGPTIDGRSYAIQRFFGPVPIHLVGCKVDLDRRMAGVRGAAAGSPHGLVQDFLNRSDAHQWAIVSNGEDLRILRDNHALSRQSFLDFDLETMFSGELYADFVLLWMVAHATRFQPREESRPESCWLERWTEIAEDEGTRALTDLRGGVEKALEALGQGFVGNPKNVDLRHALRTGQVKPTEFHAQLLRIVYRLILLFVAEDRELDGIPVIHPQDTSEAARKARERYSCNYSIGRIREMASKIKGSRHGDLWRQFQLTVGALSGDEKFASIREALALPTLGSFLWDRNSTSLLNGPPLSSNGAELSNYDFLEAIRNLAFIRQGKALRPVDYKNLGSEEFGGVYESLLSLTPQIGSDGASFTFVEFAGNERKTSGSYYTPDSLVQCLLDSTLDQVMAECAHGKKGAEAENALLSLRICDPAVGSGHFLVGAAHRLARHLARIRSSAQGDGEPSPLLYQQALRDVISHCLYGVDINPMSAELCRVSLWLEALEPGKPLSFLDHRIRVGNSLLGTNPQLVSAGIPDNAFKEIEGDEKEACLTLRKRNKSERDGHGELFSKEDASSLELLRQAAGYVDKLPDDSPDAVRTKEDAFRRTHENPYYLARKALFDTWCAAFVVPKLMKEETTISSGITQTNLQQVASCGFIPDEIRPEVEKLAKQYQFFHWPLEFPEVFGAYEGAGFDIILGNPPWEKLQVEEQEFFAGRDESIAQASAKNRKRLIKHLENANPPLYLEWLKHKRSAGAVDSLLKYTGRFPLTGTGKLNTYSLFAELTGDLVSSRGRVGCVLPLGLVTDEGCSVFFGHLVKNHRLAAVLGFENESFIFPAVHHSFKFCLLVLSGKLCPSDVTELVFFCRSVEDANNPSRRFLLSPDDVKRLNPNTLTCPIFRNRQEAELVRHIYRHIAVISSEREHPAWNVRIQRILNSTDDVGDFEVIDAKPDRKHRIEPEPSVVLEPVYEAKMFHQFDHRFGTYVGQTQAQANQGKLPEVTNSQHADPDFFAQARWWIETSIADERTRRLFTRNWIVAFRDITSPVVLRTAISAILPHFCTTETCRCVFFENEPHANSAILFNSAFNSFVFDFVCRTKFSGNHLSTFVVKQLPLPTFNEIKLWLMHLQLSEEWLKLRVLELTYTAWDLQPFAQDCGCAGPPFRWDDERRFVMRCELDAVYFHLFLPSSVNGQWKIAKIAEGSAHDETPDQLTELTKHFPRVRDAVAYIMDAFPIVKRKDEERYGYYRTKETILEIYESMADAKQTGKHYQTRLAPEPASLMVAHLPRFDSVRANLNAPGDYILAFVGSLLRHLGGDCDLMKLVRAYALLLGERSTLTSLAEARFGAEAAAWVLKFDQPVDASWFLPILRGLDNREVIRLEERGTTEVYVRLLDSAVPTNSTVETDVYLILHLVDLNAAPPATIAAEVRTIAPKPIRISLQEATPVPV